MLTLLAEGEVAEADDSLVEIKKTASADSICFCFIEAIEADYGTNLHMGHSSVRQSWNDNYQITSS